MERGSFWLLAAFLILTFLTSGNIFSGFHSRQIGLEKVEASDNAPARESLILIPRYGEFVTHRKFFAPACRQFISQDGELGEYGRLIFEAISNSRFLDSYLNEGLTDFCPGFMEMTDEHKIISWIWFFAALANEEAECKAHGTHRMFYGKKRINPYQNYGMFALELEDRLRKHRGEACHGDITLVEKQVECAVDIMGLQLARGKGAHACDSYWGPVRRGHRPVKGHRYPCRTGGFKKGQIQPYMELFTGCYKAD